MFIEVTRSGRCGLESGEDQISTDVHDVIQAPKSDLMARGVAIDLLQVAKRVGPQCDVGDRSRNLKFSMHHQDQSMESYSNEREECIYIPL